MTVNSGDGTRSPIETLLEDAQIFTGADYQRKVPTLAERVARARARERARPAARPVARADGEDRAGRELDLASARLLNTPQAAGRLAELVNSRQIEPEGAVVFACLLHLTGRSEAAEFWWKFAAGSGSATAATCLSLHHRRRAEFRDADFWLDQAAHLRAQAADSGPSRPTPACALLPDQVAEEILAQCARGERPRLPTRLEAVINQLVVGYDAADFGEIPQPSPRLPGALGTKY